MNFELGLRGEALRHLNCGSVLFSALSSILPRMTQRAAMTDATRCNGLRSALQWHMHRTCPFRPEVYAGHSALFILHFSLHKAVKPFGSVLSLTRVRTQYIYNEKGDDKGLCGWRKGIPFGSTYAAMHEAA